MGISVLAKGDTQAEAIDRARSIAMNQKSEVLIHGTTRGLTLFWKNIYSVSSFFAGETDFFTAVCIL